MMKTAEEMLNDLGYKLFMEYGNKLIYNKKLKSKYNDDGEITYSICFNKERLTACSWFSADCTGDVEDAYKLMTGEKIPSGYSPDVSNFDFIDYDLSLAITQKLKELKELKDNLIK